MRILKIFGVLFIVCMIIYFFFSEKEKGFYQYTKSESDLWRLPLIEPYELNSTTGEGENWCIINFSKLIKKFDDMNISVRVDSISLCNNLIIMYSSNNYYKSKEVECMYLTYDVTEENGNVFVTRNEYDNYLNKRLCNHIKLYDPKILYKNYARDFSLPLEWQIHIKKENRK